MGSNIFVVALFLTALTTVCLAALGTRCTDSSQCAADECCQIVNIVIASKRRQLLHPNTSGTCEKYKTQGQSCNHFDVMNGYCGCATGLTCKTVHVTTTPAPRHALLPRKMAPGYVSYCGPAVP